MVFASTPTRSRTKDSMIGLDPGRPCGGGQPTRQGGLREATANSPLHHGCGRPDADTESLAAKDKTEKPPTSGHGGSGEGNLLPPDPAIRRDRGHFAEGKVGGDINNCTSSSKDG